MTQEKEKSAGAGNALEDNWNSLREEDPERREKRIPGTEGTSGADDDDLSDDEMDRDNLNTPDLLDESPAEDESGDPDAASDTRWRTDTPSEYDRQRDASGAVPR